MAFSLMMCIPCYARSTGDDYLHFFDISEDAKNVTIKVNVPDGFDQRVDVYLNKEAHGITANENYSITIPVDEGTYDVHVIFPKDVWDQYTADVQDSLTVQSDTTLVVNVSENPAQGNTAADVTETGTASANPEGVYEDFELDISPSFYDYSDGKESGTIHIRAKNYGVFESLTYRLAGERIYDITLDREHDFEANVMLPAGKYHETGTIAFKLCDWVPEKLDMTFQWEHKDHIGDFGRYFTVNSGSTTEDGDLIVYMVNSRESTEVNANQINSGRVIKEQIEAEQAHENEKLKEAFPEDFASEAVETDAAVGTEAAGADAEAANASAPETKAETAPDDTENENAETVESEESKPVKSEGSKSVDSGKIAGISTVFALVVIAGVCIYRKKR